MSENASNREDVMTGPSGPQPPLFPRGARRVILIAATVLTVSGLYLISVRGTAMLVDLASAVGSFCF